MALTLFILGLLGGFLSGLLGLGGALILIPMMLVVPPLVGAGELSMKEVAGLSMLQVLASSLSGLIIHHRNRFVNGRVLVSVGIPMGIFSLAGSYFSGRMGDFLILLVFGILVLISFILLLLKRADNVPGRELEDFPFRPFHGVLIGGVVGFFSGVVGSGGGFILIPLMVTVLKVPLKVTVGTSLGIVFIGALLGSAGKMMSMQACAMTAIPLILGSVLAAQAGAKCSKRMKAETLRRILLAVVLISLIKSWGYIFSVLPNCIFE